MAPSCSPATGNPEIPRSLLAPHSQPRLIGTVELPSYLAAWRCSVGPSGAVERPNACSGDGLRDQQYERISSFDTCGGQTVRNSASGPPARPAVSRLSLSTA